MRLNLYVELLVVAGLVVVFGADTYQRNLIWKDDLSLWSDAVKKSPESYRPHHALGLAYSHSKLYTLALEEYQQALRIKPFTPKTHVNIGCVYEKIGKDDLAMIEYKKALRMDPNDYKAHINLGCIYIIPRRYPIWVSFMAKWA